MWFWRSEERWSGQIFKSWIIICLLLGHEDRWDDSGSDVGREMAWAQNLEEEKRVKKAGKGLPARLSETERGVIEAMQRLFQGRGDGQQCPECLYGNWAEPCMEPRVAERSRYTDGCLGRKKTTASSPPFWTLLATVTEDSQCPDWAHPDCCRLRITGFQLA